MSRTPVVIDLSDDGDDRIEWIPRTHFQNPQPIEIEDLEEAEPDWDVLVAQVLEIVPDVEPAHALHLVNIHYGAHKNDVTQFVIHTLFEDPSYPKNDHKGKRKRVDVDNEGSSRGQPRLKVDFGSTDRRPPLDRSYGELAMILLQTAHPYVPKGHIRKRFHEHKYLFAPTFLFLEHEAKTIPLPYNRKKTPFRPPGGSKGKGRTDLISLDIEAEQQWLDAREHEERVKMDATVATELNQTEYESNDAGIECGCCFDKIPFEQLVQCAEGHLFCVDCMCSYAENKLGSHDANISCMDQSGCKEMFPSSELRRFLTAKLYELYERVKQRKEIEAAGIDDLEECPFCEYRCVIDNPDEKLFYCGNEDTCGAVSCRNCKKPDHVPKSCKEMEDDAKLDGKHRVEEAMTEALMRKCPKCRQPFIKEAGCNKMACPNCHALSCYNCRKLISGYEHFDRRSPGSAGPSSGGKCLLWEPVEQRHDEEVKRAEQEAREEYKRNNPNANDEDLRVDLPQTAPQAAVHHGIQALNPPPAGPGIAHYPFGMAGFPGMGPGGIFNFNLFGGAVQDPQPQLVHYPVLPPIQNPLPRRAVHRRAWR
ncbi:hypothetical protein DL96DRAFT_50072 [Flagelloscypha sp. PMI_526]|nr:hypothetical protein DL96DRAFT_50072 [Flagelloscypha sp. PMI_526]